MRLKLLCLFIGFICGYLMIGWMPRITPFVLSNFLTELIFNPLKLFLAMSCFFIGFLANAILIRAAIEESFFLLSGRETRLGELIISYGVVGSFYLLFQMSLWLTSLFLIFSVIYGMMSIDLQHDQRYKNSM
jgi:hypothetical protein